MAGDVWISSRFAHGREEQCARNVCQPVHRPQSSPARRAGAQEGRWVKAQVLTVLLRARGWLGGAYDTQSQSVISHTGQYPHEPKFMLLPSIPRVAIARKRRLGRLLASPSAVRNRSHCRPSTKPSARSTKSSTGRAFNSLHFRRLLRTAALRAATVQHRAVAPLQAGCTARRRRAETKK